MDAYIHTYKCLCLLVLTHKDTQKNPYTHVHVNAYTHKQRDYKNQRSM